MNLTTALPIAALAGSVLLFSVRPVAFVIAALAASGLEVLMAFGLISFGISGLKVPFVLGATLAVFGLLLIGRSRTKKEIVSSTVVAMVGAIQVLLAGGVLD